MILKFYRDNYEDFGKYEILDKKSNFTLKFIQSTVEADEEGFKNLSFLRYYMFDKHNPFEIIGTISFRDIHYGGHCWCEVGYKVDMHYRRYGYAYEGLSFLVNMVGLQLGMHRVQATVQPENTPSIKLLEKLGFQWEGTMRETAYMNGAWRDHHLYAKIIDFM